MPRCQTKTWTKDEIEKALESARKSEHCPQCSPLMDDPIELTFSEIVITGPWVLSVGARDVLLTAHARCEKRDHEFMLWTSLWRKARTPVGGLRVKNKIAPKPPQRPRPLRDI